ncbi:MAG: LuxR C-terminal-related transcriptional regulator [Rhodoglobus sp.]
MATADVRTLERAFDAAKTDEGFSLALNELSAVWPQLVGTTGTRIRQFLDSTPHELWHSDPWLVTCYAASFRSVGATGHATALPYFEAAFALLTPATPAIVRATYHVRHAAALRSLGRLDDALASITLASSIAEGADVIPLAKRIPLTAEIALHRGAIHLHGGDFDRAKTDYRLAGSLAESHLSVADQLDVFGGLALIQFLLGDHENALTYVSRAESAGASLALRSSRFNAPALLTELLITVTQQGADAAEGKRDRVQESIIDSEWEPLGLYAQAYVELFIGNAHDGLDLLRSSLHALDEWQPTGFVATEIGGLRAAAFLQLGDPGAAWDVLAQLTATQHHTVCPNRLVAHLRFVTGDFRGALDAVHDCEALGDAHSSRTLADVFLIKAAALFCLGNEEKSDVAFDRSLRISARNRMHSPFRLVPSETVQAMLTRAAVRSQPLEVSALVKRLDGLTVILRPQDSLSLSDRERSIARELVRGSNPTQIGEDLYISVNTVKSHLKNIYRKLGVTSRSEAIHKARELGLQVEITRD